MFAETYYIPQLLLMASSIDVNQDVGENRGKVAGTWKEGDDRPINIYNNTGHEPPNRPQRQHSPDDRIERIEFYLYGDGMTTPGVLRQQAEIIRQQSDIIARLASMMFWLYTVTAALIILAVIAIINLVIP